MSWLFRFTNITLYKILQDLIDGKSPLDQVMFSAVRRQVMTWTQPVLTKIPDGVRRTYWVNSLAPVWEISI